MFATIGVAQPHPTSHLGDTAYTFLAANFTETIVGMTDALLTK